VTSLDSSDYDAIRDAELLDAVFMETLRFYLTGTIERKCVKDYKLPGSDFVVPKDMNVQVN